MMHSSIQPTEVRFIGMLPHIFTGGKPHCAPDVPHALQVPGVVEVRNVEVDAVVLIGDLGS